MQAPQNRKINANLLCCPRFTGLALAFTSSINGKVTSIAQVGTTRRPRTTPNRRSPLDCCVGSSGGFTVINQRKISARAAKQASFHPLVHFISGDDSFAVLPCSTRVRLVRGDNSPRNRACYEYRYS